MKQVEPKIARRENGYSLMAVMMFIVVVTIAGMAFFTISSHESRAAIHRQETTEAFYLADAAVERARAKFLDDRAWRDGWTDVDLGNGTYSLTVQDTSFGGMNDCVYMVAAGTIGSTTRRIEMIAEVPPSALDYAVNAGGDVEVKGNFCIQGNIHVSGDPDFGNHGQHLKCGDLTEGFDITPPAVHTDPAHFPDATYYYVRGTKVGSDYQAKIYDAAGNDITASLGVTMEDVVSYNNGSKTFTYDFDSNSLIEKYFNTSTGVFSRASGDVGVVVNFGETPVVNPPGVAGISNVILDGNHSLLKTTIVNTRFIGATDDQRLDTDYWTGGNTYLKQITLEPDNGMAVLTHDFMDNGGSNVDVGTATTPAYVYITGDVDSANANFELTGAVTLLGDWESRGHITITYDEGFLSSLPSYLFDTFTDDVTGTLKVLTWGEI